MLRLSPAAARTVAVALPVLAAAVLTLLRDVLANTSAALVLVLVLVARWRRSGTGSPGCWPR